MTTLLHPLTGVAIAPDDVRALRRAALDAENWLGEVMWRRTSDVRDRLAEVTKHLAETTTTDLPKPSRRSETQQRVAICPRCKGQIA